jgi:hypothetical protein
MTSLAVPPRNKVVAGGHGTEKWYAPTCPELETLVIVCKRVSAKEREPCLAALGKINEERLGTATEMKVPELACIQSTKRARGTKRAS